MFTLEAHPEGLNTFCMTFMPGEAPLLASAGKEGVRVWDLRQRSQVCELSVDGHSVSSLSCSPDGTQLVVAHSDSPTIVHIWDWAKKKLLREINGGRMVQCAIFSPDGQILALGGYTFKGSARDNAIRRMNLATGHWRRSLQGHTGQTGILDFSSDGTLLASGAADQQAILWDLHRREAVLFAMHKKVVWGVKISPDGSVLATTGGWTVHLFDVESRKKLGQLRGHRNVVYGIAFSPDGKTLASVSGDRTVRLWDVQSRRVRRVLDWGLGSLSCVGFSGDGMLAAAGSEEGTLVVWDVDE